VGRRFRKGRRRASVTLVMLALVGTVTVLPPPGTTIRAETAGAGGVARVQAAVATGGAFTCAILDDTALKCFGANNSGQLGLGDTDPRGVSPHIGNGLPQVDVGNYAAFNPGVLIQVAAGHDHACVILANGVAPNVGSNGRVKCWGSNNSGQLGLGHSQARGDGPNEMGENLPFVDLGTGRSALQIAAGDRHTCAILDNGGVKCWGYGFYGQLGYGNQVPRGDEAGEMGDNLPFVDLGTGRTATAISAHSWHTCALLDDRTLKCWGNNEFGQLGQGDTENRGDEPGEMGDNLPAIDLGTDFSPRAVSSGGAHVCATGLDGVKCWGEGSGGRLGIGSIDRRGDQPGEMGNNLPFVNLGDASASVISAGSGHTCAFSTAVVKCWGLNGFGQLGLGDTTNRGTSPAQMGAALPSVPVPMFTSAISAGDTHTCVVSNMAVFELRCWGNGSVGRLGTGAATTIGDQAGEVAGLAAVNLGTGRSVSLRPSVPARPSGLSLPVWSGNTWQLNVATSFDGGGLAFVGYRVERSLDGGRTWTELGTTSATTFDITNQLLGTRPLFRVRGVNNLGAGPPSFPQYPRMSTATPARLLDTRASGTTIDGQFQKTGLQPAGSTVELQITGRGAVPPDAVAVALNLTSSGSTAAGFVTVYPCGSQRPNASNLNHLAGRTVPNAVIAQIGTGGKVCVYTEAPSQLIADVTGWFLPPNNIVTRSPARLLDTRSSGQTFDGQAQRGGLRAARSTLALQITGRAGVPSDAGTVVLNVTTSGSTAPGFVTVFPCGDDPPNASNLNYVAGLTVANLVVAKIGTEGQVCLFTESATHLIADITAYFPIDGTPPTTTSPARMLDTRLNGQTYDGAFRGQGRLAAGEVVELAIQGRPGITLSTEVVLMNVTVSGATAAGFITVYPCGTQRPNASNLNYVAGQTVPNLAVAKLGQGGKVCLYTESPANLIVDVSTQL
jgi:alpha-tubulin suppressor-like RCC1 family protein